MIRADEPFVTNEILLRLCRSFDLDPDIAVTNTHLSRDAFLVRLVAARPTLRAPGCWERLETAARAILTQQVTMAAARRLNDRLMRRAVPIVANQASGRSCRVFPTPDQVLAADLSAMGMPYARVRTLQSVAEGASANPHFFRGETIGQTVDRLSAIKGLGPWTAHVAGPASFLISHRPLG